jgi:NitT/TauT family transport system substrate-binding protein
MPLRSLIKIWLLIIVSFISLSGCGYFGKKKAGKDRPLRVGVVTWPGYAGGIVANNGFKPNTDCIFYKSHGIQVEFLLMEDVDVRNKAFAKGGDDGVDIVWSTVDFWANELPAFVKDGNKARAIMQVDWSRGGDAIVADQSIQKIEDLKGKKISLALFTPSHWLLEYNIENSSLTDSEQADIMKNLIGKPASPDARADFVSGNADAAVVWEPDVTEALNKRQGSHIVVSSKTASNLIADLMVAREDFIKENPEVIKAFVQGWLDGTQEANRNRDQVVRLLMENEPVYRDLGAQPTRAGLDTVRWADLTDNTKMFGLDGGEPLFDKIFKQAGAAWVKRGYISQTINPDQARDITFLKEIYAISPVQAPSDPTVAPPTEEIKKQTATTTKPVDILFASGSSTLDAAAKQGIDNNIALVAETNSNAYIRIEGNTDNVGSRDVNIKLSRDRAQAVVDYLIQRYKFNSNRFIVVGNGPDNPRKDADNTTNEGRAKNRRTDISVVPVK